MYKSKSLTFTSILFAALFFSTILTAAVKDWSAWTQAEGDDAIEFRFKVTTYGQGLTPSCSIEVRNTFANVGRVDVSITVETSKGPVKSDRTIWLSSREQKGIDEVFTCNDLREFRVRKTDRRAKTKQPL